MIEIVWFRGAEGVYWRDDDGAIAKLGDDRLLVLKMFDQEVGYRLVQAADQPEYIRWPQ